jgi:hypothetical protein
MIRKFYFLVFYQKNYKKFQKNQKDDDNALRNVHLVECVTRFRWCVKNPLKWSDDDDATLNYVPLIVSGIFPLQLQNTFHNIITTKNPNNILLWGGNKRL